MSTAGFVRRRRACGDEGAGARRGGGARGLSEGVCPKARGERVPRVGSECPAGPRGQESHRGERDALGSLSGECAGPSQGMRVTEAVRGGGVQQPGWGASKRPLCLLRAVRVQMPVRPRSAPQSVRVQEPRGVGDVRCPATRGGCAPVNSVQGIRVQGPVR